MKRAHRRSHLLIWALLGPAMLGLLAFSISFRPEAPTNEMLPELLIEESR